MYPQQSYYNSGKKNPVILTVTVANCIKMLIQMYMYDLCFTKQSYISFLNYLSLAFICFEHKFLTVEQLRALMV